MNLLSAMCLFILAWVCIAGVFSRNFHENWLQFFGLAAICIWAVARMVRVIEGEEVTTLQLLCHAGMASFAVGTTYKVLTPRTAFNLIGKDRRHGHDRRNSAPAAATMENARHRLW